MFTLKQIDNWLSKAHRDAKADKHRESMIKYYADLEKNLAISRCPIKNQEDNFEGELFKKLQLEEFSNPQLNWIGECFIDSLNKGKDKFLINQKIKNHLINLRKIGVEGAHGFAFIADYQSRKKKTKDIFVIKSGMSEDLRFDESRHEVIVGLELNKLRNRVPNFAYVYGGFTCGLPMIINKKAENWCSSNGNVNYVVYEYIENKTRFQDYCAHCSTEQFIEKYLQILNAINIAHKEIDFTHYDLHNDNVLMRMIPGVDKIAIQYPFADGRNRYLLTDMIMTIIDYGFAHLRKNKQDIGNPLFTAYGIHANQSNIYGDAFKLLAFCMNTMKVDNYPVYRSLFPLMKFFDNKDNVDQIIDEGREDLYSSPRVTDKNLDDLITFILKNYRCPFIVDSVPKGYQLIICQECTSMSKVIKMFNSQVDTYEDILENIYDHGKENISKNQYLEARDNKLIELNKIEDKIKKLLLLIDGRRLDVSGLFDLNYMREYKKYLSNLAKIINLRDKLKYNLLLLNYAARIYDDSSIKMEHVDKYYSLFARITANYKQMLHDSDKLERERDKTTTKTIVNKKPVFNWWWSEERSAFVQ